LTPREVITFWVKASIATKQEYHVSQKIKDLHTKWINLKKKSLRRSNNQILKENKFISTLDNLFDIAHANAPNLMIIKEDKFFFC